MITTFLAGLVMGLVGSMPPTGPVAVIVLGLGVRSRTADALSFAVGAAIAESGYALIVYLGADCALSRLAISTSLLRVVSAAMLIVVAAAFLIRRIPAPSSAMPEKRRRASFIAGLAMAGLNPTFLATWTGAIAVARSLGVIEDAHHAPAFALGVLAGPVLWFRVLVTVIASGRIAVVPRVLIGIERAVPIVLLILAAAMLIPFLQPHWPEEVRRWVLRMALISASGGPPFVT